MKHDILVAVRRICKSFGATKALVDVTMDIRKGEIHGLIGENGSGKSTISAIISGVYQANSGEMEYNGQPYFVIDSMEAAQKGISIILQEQGTFLKMTVAENIFVGIEEEFRKRGIISNKEMRRAAAEALEYIGASHIDPAAFCMDLSFEDRKIVEIARCMHYNPKLLIIDETTTALSKSGRTILYKLVKKIKREGASVLMISHDIDEVMELCDRLTVLRDGQYIKTIEKKDYSPKIIKSLMVGREIDDKYYRTDYDKTDYTHKKILLEVKEVDTDKLNDITISVHSGEILGLGGLTECGMHELGKIMFGDMKVLKGGAYTKNGDAITSAAKAAKNAIAYISKDRDKESLMLFASICDNICLPSLPKLKKNGFITNNNMKGFADEWCDKLRVKMSDPQQYVNELSGGNKQKVALSKWLGFNAEVFIVDCPTRGIDVGVKAAIYELMEQLRSEGKAIVMISEELPELLGMCDNIGIMKNGSITGIFERDRDLDQHVLIEYMI